MSNKKMIIPILIIIMFIIIIPKNEFAKDNNETQTQQEIIGDVNGDKIVNTNDLILVLRHNYATSTGKHTEWILQGDKFKAADVTKNEIVDSSDVISISRYIASSSSQEIAKKHPEWKEMKTSKEVIEITNIALDKNSLNLEEGKTSKLTATISPSNATDKQLTWKTSNSKVATVDTNGNVTAIKVGKAIITVKSSNGKESKCNIEVKSKATSTPSSSSTSDTSAIKTLKIDAPSTNKVTVGQEYKFKAIVDPKKAASSLKWSIGNSSIASIKEQYLDTNNNATVKIKANKKGTTTLEVTAPDGKTAKCSIVVEEKQTSSSSSSSKSSSSSSSSGSSSSSSSSKSSSSSSSSKSSSSSSSSKSSSSSSSSKSSSSSSSENKISIYPKETTLVADEKLKLQITTDLKNVEIEWSSNNSSVVTVNNKGEITAKPITSGYNQETATITAKIKNSTYQATCIVHVKNIIINPQTIEISSYQNSNRTGMVNVRVKKGAPVSVTQVTGQATGHATKMVTAKVEKDNNIKFTIQSNYEGKVRFKVSTKVSDGKKEKEYSEVLSIKVKKPQTSGGSSSGTSSGSSSGEFTIKIVPARDNSYRAGNYCTFNIVSSPDGAVDGAVKFQWDILYGGTGDTSVAKIEGDKNKSSVKVYLKKSGSISLLVTAEKGGKKASDGYSITIKSPQEK